MESKQERKLDQKKGMVRNILVALAALMVSFDLIPESSVDVLIASGLAGSMALWGIITKPHGGAAFGSFLRKGMAAIPPVLVLFDYIDSAQGVSMTAMIFAFVALWSFGSKQPSTHWE